MNIQSFLKNRFSSDSKKNSITTNIIKSIIFRKFQFFFHKKLLLISFQVLKS